MVVKKFNYKLETPIHTVHSALLAKIFWSESSWSRSAWIEPQPSGGLWIFRGYVDPRGSIVSKLGTDRIHRTNHLNMTCSAILLWDLFPSGGTTLCYAKLPTTIHFYADVVNYLETSKESRSTSQSPLTNWFTTLASWILRHVSYRFCIELILYYIISFHDTRATRQVTDSPQISGLKYLSTSFASKWII